MDTQPLTLLQDIAELMNRLEDESSMLTGTAEAQPDNVTLEEPVSDINQQFVGVRRSAWVHSVAFESIKSPSDILYASDKDVFCLHAFLTKLSSHIGFNSEVTALGDPPNDQLKIKYSELHYLSLAHGKSELQVEKFMSHHCHDGSMGVVVYLMRSG